MNDIELLKSIDTKEAILSTAEDFADYIKAIKRVLKQYEKLEQENEELKNNIIPGLKEEIKGYEQELKNIKDERQEFLFWEEPNKKYTDDNYISKAVIKSKLEKLEKDLREADGKYKNSRLPEKKELFRVLGIRIDERLKAYNSLLKECEK